MSLFARIVTEHQHWLAEKGYLNLMNLTQAAGNDLIDQLRAALYHAVADHFWQGSSRYFWLSVHLRPINSTDQIVLQLEYRYDPNLIKLYLMAVNAARDKACCRYLIGNNRRSELPHAQQVIARLAKPLSSA